MRVQRFATRAELQSALEERLWQALTSATAAGGPPAVMLSGGTTPIPAYLHLAKRGLKPAPGLAVLFSDDRYVPSDSDQSNYHQCRPLLDALKLSPEQVLRVRTELPLEEAAADSERRLQTLLSGRRIALGLLGLGADGHTASLFSAEALHRTQGRLAISVQRPDGRAGISVTPTVLQHVDQLVFVVAGADKRTALAALLAREQKLTAWNAVAGCPGVEVWADEQALG